MPGKKDKTETFNCANCGTEVRITARSCPECGADDETGWKENTSYSRVVSETEDDFEYDEFVEQEFGEQGAKPKNMSWLTWTLAILLIGAIVAFMVLR